MNAPATIQATRVAADLDAARDFLRRLDPEASHFTLQTFDDTPRKRRELAKVHEIALDGPGLATLEAWNSMGAGVFVTINATDGRGRQAHNVERVRALFADLDGAPLEPVRAAGLRPHMIVETSPGRWHAYWLTDDCPLDRFERVQRAIAARFDGDPSVHDLPRVMRLPGFAHMKRDPFRVRLIAAHDEAPYALGEIVGTLKLDLSTSPQRHATIAAPEEKIGPGSRHGHLFALGRSLAKKGASAAAVRGALVAENAERCEPTLDAGDVDYLARRAFKAKDAATWSAGSHEKMNGAHNPHVEARSSATPAPADDAPAPIDILRTMAAPRLRASDVPAVLGAFAEAQARATGFDISILLAAGIGAACAALSDEVRLCVAPQSAWFESARLWLAVVGGPGAGKSPGSKLAMAPIFALHREGIAEWSKRADPDDATAMPLLYASDATTEALADALAGNERGLVYFTDELESWLASHDAYRAAGGKDRGEWLRLYDGGPHQVNRVKRGAFFVANWGASLLSATTPAALRKLAPKLPDDGLLQRLLLVVAHPRAIPDASAMRVETRGPADAWDAALRRLYAAPAGVVRLSAEARAIFDDEQAELHRLTEAFEDSHPSLASHYAKRAGMLARLVLAFHALDGDVRADVAPATMRTAVRFMRRQEHHAVAVYTSTLGRGDTGHALARDIARSILASGLDAFNRREITQRCKPFRNADEPTRQAALGLLRDCGWITPEGHPLAHGAAWLVNGGVHTLFAEHGEAMRRRRELVRARMTAPEGDE